MYHRSTLKNPPTRQCGDGSSLFYQELRAEDLQIPQTAVWGSFKSFLFIHSGSRVSYVANEWV